MAGVHPSLAALVNIQSPSDWLQGFPGGSGGKEPTCECRRCKRRAFDPWVEKIPWRRARQPTPVLMSGESRDRGACEPETGVKAVVMENGHGAAALTWAQRWLLSRPEPGSSVPAERAGGKP